MKTFATTVSAFIESQGHKTDLKVSDDGQNASVAFRSRGVWMIALPSENDRRFLPITCSMPIGDDVAVSLDVLQAVLRVQDRVKAIKFAPIDGERRLLGSVELLFDGEDGYVNLFWRAVAILELGMREALTAIEETCVAKVAAEKFIETLVRGEAA